MPSKVSSQIINDVKTANSCLSTNFNFLDEKCLLTKELKKSFIKADLRFKHSQIILLKKFINELTGKNSPLGGCQNLNGLILYPLIHLPFDELEAGSLHVDHMFAGEQEQEQFGYLLQIMIIQD